jgi:hypothetical protein
MAEELTRDDGLGRVTVAGIGDALISPQLAGVNGAENGTTTGPMDINEDLAQRFKEE